MARHDPSAERSRRGSGRPWKRAGAIRSGGAVNELRKPPELLPRSAGQRDLAVLGDAEVLEGHGDEMAADAKEAPT